MNTHELAKAEEALELAGWTISTRAYGPGCWYAVATYGRAHAFRYSADDVTRHGAREQVVELATETQRIMSTHSDTERPVAET